MNIERKDEMSRITTTLSVGILAIVFPVMAFALSVPSDRTLEKADLGRFADPVLIQAEAFPALAGGALDNYRVFAAPDGALQPIRFQIDEMTEEGDFVFPYGKQSNKKQSNGVLDPRDVVLFMAKDSGDRVSETLWPGRAAKGVEIELIDPVDQTRSWAYLFFFEEDPPPPCPLPDYLQYDFDTERLETKYWRAKYAVTKKGKHTNYYDEFVILPAGGGNGENFIDRLKVRATIKLFFGQVTIKKDEKNLDSRALNAWIHGPIRVVRRLEHKVKGPLGMNLVRILSDVQYYQTMFTTPIHLYFPFKIERVVSSMHLRIGTDYAPVVKGSTFYNSNNLEGIRIDGKTDETEESFHPEADQWRVMTGEWGSFMTRSVLTPEAEERLDIVQGITDDETFIDPPETFPGCVGWTWQDWRVGQLPGGHYTFYLEFYAPPHYKPGKEVAYLNYLDHPIRLRVGDQTYENKVSLYGTPGKAF
jgi:hypothetical protein